MRNETHYSIWGYGPTICGKSTKYRKLKVTTDLDKADCEACGLVIRTVQDPIKDELKKASTATAGVAKYKHLSQPLGGDLTRSRCGLSGFSRENCTPFSGDITCPRCIREHERDQILNKTVMHYSEGNTGGVRCMIAAVGSWRATDDLTMITCLGCLRELGLANERRARAGIQNVNEAVGVLKSYKPVQRKADWERQRMNVLLRGMADKRVANEEVPDIWLEEYLDLWILFNDTIPKTVKTLDEIREASRRRKLARQDLDPSIPPYITEASGGLYRQPVVTFGNRGEPDSYTIDFNLRHFWPRGYGRPICVVDLDEKYIDVPVYGHWSSEPDRHDAFCHMCGDKTRKLSIVISD